MRKSGINALFVLLSVFFLFLVGAGCSGHKSSDKPSVRYVALGDSIAYGPVAADRSGYVYDFGDFLKTTTADEVRLNNLAVPLLKTGQLLEALKNDVPAGIRSAVKNAQVLTISIGGNNLLACANDEYRQLNLPCMASGASSFGEDWPKILSEIRTIGSQAKLYVMTVYNPYRGDDPNYTTADMFVRQINAVIVDPAQQAAYPYKIADVYTDFQGQLSDGTWKTCTWTRMCQSPRDVHPNQSGHQEIARLHRALYP